MEDVKLDQVYKIIGELYFNSRVRLLELEETLQTASQSGKKLSEEYNRILAELNHLKMKPKPMDEHV